MHERAASAYWSFISYSHADAAVGAWLHRALERYRLPRSLRDRPSAFGPIPKRLYPIFRDEVELAGAPSLSASIDRALRASRSLIVICSPQSAASPWVDREIRRFRGLGHGDRIFAFLVAGEPATSFPPALLEGDEPLAADARAGRRTRRSAMLRLVAGILQLSYDDLARREAVRRRRTRAAIGSGVTALIAIGALGYVGLADNRNDIPFAPAIRTALDRHDLSVFRHAPDGPALRDRATVLRRPLVTFLARAGAETRYAWIFGAHAPEKRDPWTAAQASAGAFGSSDLTRPQADAFGRNLDLAFAPRQAETDERNALYGWKAIGSVTSTAEVSLWTAFALELELVHVQLAPDRRRTVVRELRVAQATAGLFGPFPDGHFGEGPHQIGGYSTYATAMAYLALLAARDAHVGWQGSPAKRETEIRSVRGFLLRHFGEAPNRRGWLPDANPDAVGHQYEGLDDQIISAFLHDERSGGNPVPPAVGRAIPAMIGALELRRFDVQYSSAILSYRSRDARGVVRSESRLIEFDWYQWALAATAEWMLALTARASAPHEDVVEARRVLGRLLDDGDDMLRTVVPQHNVWVSAETAYALGGVVSP